MDHTKSLGLLQAVRNLIKHAERLANEIRGSHLAGHEYRLVTDGVAASLELAIDDAKAALQNLGHECDQERKESDDDDSTGLHQNG